MLAVNKAGDMVLRVWRVHASEEGWKDYRLSALVDIEMLDETFDSPRPGYDPLNADLLWVIYRL